MSHFFSPKAGEMVLLQFLKLIMLFLETILVSDKKIAKGQQESRNDENVIVIFLKSSYFVLQVQTIRRQLHDST